jgi:3-hydroxybutyryl-CoA dehydrogenase
MKIETVGVIDAGTMGNGIAQVFALARFPVVIQDLAQAALDRTSLERQAKKGTVAPAAAEAALARITPAATPEDIDSMMKLAANHPMGPQALGD